MRYRIIEAESREGLETAVQEAILGVHGWRPHGGVAVSIATVTRENERKGYTEVETQTIWAQAMVTAGQVIHTIAD